MQPGEELIVLLEELRLRLSNSGVERTAGLLRSMDSTCDFYRKSLDIFVRKDYEEIKALVARVKELMQ